MSEATFQQALGALTDANYRKDLETDPTKLFKDYDLSPSEKVILMAVGEASGSTSEVSGYLASSGGTYCCCCCCP